jgi:hypothetical protein
MLLLSQSREIFPVCTSDIPSLHFYRAKADVLRDSGLAYRSSGVINRSQTLNAFSTEELEKLLGCEYGFRRTIRDASVVQCVQERPLIRRAAWAGGLRFSRKASLASILTQFRRNASLAEYFAIVSSDCQAPEENRG